MLTYKIFLAGSCELLNDRNAFGDVVQELNDTLKQQGKKVHFSLYKWERDYVSFAECRKQNTYNEHIETCDVFMLLYDGRVGKYTDEEYDFAYDRFRHSGAPQVLVLKKRTSINADESAQQFEAKIANRDKQFNGWYDDARSLKTQFFDEIQKCFANGLFKEGIPAKTLYSDGQSVPPNFIGRTEDLKVIRDRLDKSGNLVLVNAEGGIGKTTLAAKYWKESMYDYERNAWLFCEGGIVSALKKLAPALGIDLRNMSEEEQIVALKAGLLNESHSFLLVLDNANDEEHIHAFKETFRGFHWHVLITSRCTGVLEHEQELRIDHLPPLLATALFESNYKEDNPKFDILLDNLLQSIGYHTLLTEIFSKYLRELKRRGEGLKEFLAHLETRGLFMEGRALKINTDYSSNRHKKTATNDDVLNILYDFSELKEEERHLLVNIALLPAVTYQYDFLAGLFRLDAFHFEPLKRLTRKGWLATDEEGGYRISPVIQRIAIEKNKATLAQDAEAMIVYLNEKLEESGGRTQRLKEEAVPYMELAESIVCHFMDAPFFELYVLAHNARRIRSKYWDEAWKAGRAMNILSGDNNITALLGGIYGMHEHKDDLWKYGEFNKLEKALYDANPDNVKFADRLAASCEKLGNIYETLGRREKALQQYREYNRLKKELYDANPDNIEFKYDLAICCGYLGNVYAAWGTWESEDEALQQYVEFNRLIRELHDADPDNVKFKTRLAISCQYLGNIHGKRLRSGVKEALQHYGEYNRLEKELYAANPDNVEFKSGLAMSYLLLGQFTGDGIDTHQVIVHCRNGEELLSELVKEYPGYVLFKEQLLWVQSRLREFAEKAATNGYDFSELEEEERHLLVNIALLPATIYQRNFLASLFWQDAFHFEPLERLARKGWLASDQEGGYRISPVIQRIAIEKNKATLALDAAAIIDCLNEKLEHSGGYTLRFKEAAPYAALVDNIVSHLMDKPFLALSLLAQNACVYFINMGNLSEAQKAARNDQAMNIQMGNMNNLAISHLYLGQIYEKQGRQEEARQQYLKYSMLVKELYDANPDNVGFKNNLAISCQYLGNIYAVQGRQEEALHQYGECNRLEKELHDANPDNTEFKNRLAISCHKLGNIYSAQGRQEEALQQYGECNRLEKELHDANSDNVVFKHGLAVSCLNLGSIYAAQDRQEEALQQYGECNRLEKELHDASPDNVEFKNGLAVSCQNLGIIYAMQGRQEEALLQCGEYNRLEKELYDASPDNVEFKHGLATSCQNLGVIYEAQRRQEEALQRYWEYNRIAKELYNASPDNVEYKSNLAISCQYLGRIYAAQGRQEEALQQYQEGYRLTKELYNTNPDNVEFKNGLATHCQFLARIYDAQGRQEEALQFYRLEKELYDSNPDDVEFKHGLAISCQYLGHIYEAQGRQEDALQQYEEFYRLEKELYDSNPDNVRFKQGLATSCQNFGDIYEAQGRQEDALQQYEEFYRLERELYDSNPDNVEFKHGLAISCQYIGRIYEVQGRHEEAMLQYEEFNRLEKELYDANPNNVEFKRNLAIAYQNFGDIYEAQGRQEDALRQYREYNRLEKELYDSNPDNIKFKNGLAHSYLLLGWLLSKSGEIDQVIAHYGNGEKLLGQLVSEHPGDVHFEYNLSWVQSRLRELCDR